MAHLNNLSGLIWQGDRFADVLRWLGKNLLIYFVAAAMAAGLFAAGAFIYSVVVPRENPVITPVPEITGPVYKRAVPPEPITSDPPLLVSSIVGLEVYGPRQERVGKVWDVLLDRNGNASTIVIGLEGHWWNKKYVSMPYSSLQLVSEQPDPDSTALAAKAERAVIPYDLNYLQHLPMGAHPLIPLKGNK